MKELIVGKIRIQLIADGIYRFEVKGKDGFEDSDTFFAPKRKELFDEVELGFSYSVKNHVVTIVDDLENDINAEKKTIMFHLDENATSLRSLKVYQGKKKRLIYSYKKIKNTGELPEPGKTPFIFPLMDSPRIILPEKGYGKGEGEYKIDENAIDLYLIIAENDPYILRERFIAITGKSPLPRKKTFGLWNSRYYAYTQKEAEDMILEYERRGVPLDNMVIDTDWRISHGANGIGYDINAELFPDMKGFFEFAHNHHVSIMFNDHPEPLNGATDLLDIKEQEFREEKLTYILSLGLDTWWYDRNWITKLKTPTSYIEPESFGMYLFTDITKHFHEQNKNGEYPLRDDVMSNVNDIRNGEYIRINDSASHRYPFQWTGDISSTYESLSQEVSNLIKGQDNLIPYINSDIGGHTGNPDKDCYLKWIQFGAMSPILRPHCTNGVRKFREPWNYDEKTFESSLKAIELRYRLIPLIYSCAYANYLCGHPIFSSLGMYDYEDKKSCQDKKSYILANDILVSPIEQRTVSPFKNSYFIEPVKTEFYLGRELKGDVVLSKEYKTLDFSLDGNSLEPELPPYEFSARFKTKIRLPKDYLLCLASDDGISVYLDGVKVFEDWSSHAASVEVICPIKGKEEHTLELEYYQGDGQARLCLYTAPYVEMTKRSIYLPLGEWIDVYTGDRYKGRNAYLIDYPIDRLPMFIRKGSIIPLVANSMNVDTQDMSEVTLDCYPDLRDGVSENGFVYEDDGKTTAYQDGHSAFLDYSMEYDKNSRKTYIRIYKDDSNYSSSIKQLTFRVHLPTGSVPSFYFNDEKAEFTYLKKDQSTDILPHLGATCDSDVCILKHEAVDDLTLTIDWNM